MSDLNDPRVLFAAERTLLAWTRTASGLMALGFFIDRAALMTDAAKSGERRPRRKIPAFTIVAECR